MQYRVLGKTGIAVSAISFGAGPISTLMVGEDRQLQLQVIEHAISHGINWFDTASTYGQGASETNLGFALREVTIKDELHIATKVRFAEADLFDVETAARRSLETSLQRLQLSKVRLLQLHNSVTPHRGDEPTSLTPRDVLGKGGIADAFDLLRDAGYVDYLGFTGIGHPSCLAELATSRRFDTIQVPYHLLNPSAGQSMPPDFSETNYGNIIDSCARQGMGIFVIRVLAGGALAGNEPSPHTYKTPFFPLDLFWRDRQRASVLSEQLAPAENLADRAIRFALEHPQVHSAIIGFASTSQVNVACAAIGQE